MRVGTIELGPRVMVSDPCYSVGTWCQAAVDVKPGKWKCYYYLSDEGESWGIRISSMRIKREGESIASVERIDADIGVDSGQAGFFDFDYYAEQHRLIEEARKEDKYSRGEWAERVFACTYKEFTPDMEKDPRYIQTMQWIEKRREENAQKSAEWIESTKKSLIEKGQEITTEMEEHLKDLSEVLHHDHNCEIRWHKYSTADTIDNKGFTSSSGYGDGGYTLYAGRNSQGEIVMLRVVFIPK